ncbi:MAG TPA: tRNA (adenosine(37)-N6)-threonylcarbamoyltransferase complex ATPase subunit type 1 TsaE [Actinomycetota bacterium]
MPARELHLTSAGAEQTRAIAALVARALRPGDVVALSGDLGAGKTAFVQGAAAALGVTARVTSPSFVLARKYAGDLDVLHVDVYRLNSIQELIDLGYEEVFSPDYVLFIEWGDAVDVALPPERLEVEITVAADERRSIVLRGLDGWADRLDAIDVLEEAGR